MLTIVNCMHYSILRNIEVTKKKKKKKTHADCYAAKLCTVERKLDFDHDHSKVACIITIERHCGHLAIVPTCESKNILP